MNRRESLAAITGLGAAVGGALVLKPGNAHAAKGGNATFVLPVAGTDATGLVSAVGTLAIREFVNQNGNLAASGTVTANLYDAVGNLIGKASQKVTVPVAVPGPAAAIGPAALVSCDVLSLVLGPLHLDLLGLVIDLNQVVLNITAVPGAGNLLGNLLCAIAGILDGGIGDLLDQLVGLLNQLLGLFP